VYNAVAADAVTPAAPYHQPDVEDIEL
jgi:hypothetical protein